MRRVTEPNSLPRALAVSAPARLHLGFLDPDGRLGRRFGSLGLAVDQPATDLVLAPAAEFSAEGLDAARAEALLTRLAATLDLRRRYRVRVARAIPAHAGLGSGTQLALAIGAGLMRLEGRTADAKALGEFADRGARSAIGIAAFAEGGFIIDAGKGSTGRAPPVVARAPFPDPWRALLVLDPASQGVHGEQEVEAFAALPAFPAATAAHLCHLALMRLLPGLHDADIAAFGAAVTEIQGIVGGHFAAAQGGSPWSSPAVGRLVARMGALGAVGLGQSSWGPTGFAFVPGDAAAQSLYRTLVEDAKAEGLEILIVRGRNTGARMEVVSDAG